MILASDLEIESYVDLFLASKNRRKLTKEEKEEMVGDSRILSKDELIVLAKERKSRP